MKQTLRGVTTLALLAALILAACDNSANPGGDAAAPAVVTGLNAAPGDGRATLTWTDPADADLDSIEITYSPQTDAAQPVSVGTGVQTAAITGLTNGKTYTFTVKAVDAAGNKSKGVNDQATPDAPLTAISDVGNHLAKADGGSSAADPVPLAMDVDLAGDGWEDLFSAIESAGKYVNLDLSACDMDGTEFNPYSDSNGEGKIVSLTLPSAAASIKPPGPYSNGAVFKSFTALKHISGEGLETITDQAFSGCTVLETVNFPAAHTIDHDAFSNCTALQSVSLPAAHTIGDQAFYGCSALKTVSLPAAHTINQHAFSNCTALEKLNLPLVHTIGRSVFSGCFALEAVSLPATLTAIGENPFASCVYLTTITVDPANPYFTAEKGMLLTKDRTTLIAYPGASGVVTDTELPITSIGDSAFENCTALKEVNLPAAQTIGYHAFFGCTTLKTVSLPEAQTIDNYAFYNCDALETVSLPKAQNIGISAFGYTGSRALTVTLGAAAPTLGNSMFTNFNTAKTVTVLVPSDAEGYGDIPVVYNGGDNTVTWGNGFRGGGWDGAGFTFSSYINSNITLVIQYEGNE